MKRVSAVLGLLSSPGCGILLVEGPPPVPPRPARFCTESMALPRLDAALGSLYAITAMVAATNRLEGFTTESENRAIAVTSAIYDAVQYTSWAVGQQKVVSCRRAKLAHLTPLQQGQSRASVRPLQTVGTPRAIRP